MIDFECQFSGRRPRQLIMPDTDPGTEMGFLPLLAAAIPMVTSLAGSLLSKKGKKGNAPPEAAQAQNVLDLLTKAVGGDESKGESSIKEVVANIVRTIPPPVMRQVKEGISQLKKAEAATKESRSTLVNAIDARFGPQVHALLAAVKAQQLQTAATDEHRRLKARAAFISGTTNTLGAIERRLCAMEKRLGGVAIVSGKNRISVMGGRSVLER